MRKEITVITDMESLTVDKNQIRKCHKELMEYLKKDSNCVEVCLNWRDKDIYVEEVR